MKHAIYFSLLIVLIGVQCGCSSLADRQAGKNPFRQLLGDVDHEEDQDQVTKMAVIWKDTVYNGAGKSIRGFGGRVFFYNESNQPMEADGEFLVYGFDDSEKESQGAAADRKYVFEREKLASHFSESEMGPSYSFWIPWEKAGGVRKTITLIPVFKTEDGRVVKSGQSIQTLPGKEPKGQSFSTERGNVNNSFKVLGSSPAIIENSVQRIGEVDGQSDNEPSGVVRASYDESSTASVEGKSANQGRTSTFLMPQSMATRIANTNRQLTKKKTDGVVAQSRPVSVSDTKVKQVPLQQNLNLNTATIQKQENNRSFVQSTSSDPEDMMKRWRSQIPRTSQKARMLENRAAGSSVASAIAVATPNANDGVPNAGAEPANNVTRVYGQPGAFK